MKVLVTGGAGFLGRGILRQSERAEKLNWEVTVFSRDEAKQDLCRQRYPKARYILGDVRDTENLVAAMAGHDAVVHAAAMKRIPEAEINASECIRVNVNGSQSVITAARRAGVARVVAISTDKAVQPVNVYGASKMIMERLFSEASGSWGGSDIAFNCVRYGNVVGSTGSVIPLFQQQLKETGSVKLTDPAMTRYWMSVDEAVMLIVTAMIATPGAIIVPRPRAMFLKEVALAATSDDVPIDIIGTRPGEKLHELLMHHEESVRSREHEGYYELLPPGTPGTFEAFSLASHNPSYWMSRDEMRELIADAQEV